jgi:X-X-X-Leu-X-X-Gly heptad repeat protein
MAPISKGDRPMITKLESGAGEASSGSGAVDDGRAAHFDAAVVLSTSGVHERNDDEGDGGRSRR